MRRKLAIMKQQYADGQVDLAAVGHRIQSWIGHAAHADSYRLRERILGSVTFQRGETGDAAGRLVDQQPDRLALCRPGQLLPRQHPRPRQLLDTQYHLRRRRSLGK